VTLEIERIVVLGVGYAGSAIVALARARGLALWASTRSAERAQTFRDRGIPMFCGQPAVAIASAQLTLRDHVVVTFPPDGVTDALVAPLLQSAQTITYLSSTGVYGSLRGTVDDSTQLPAVPSATVALRLRAEESYRAFGAVVLRCPGIYGTNRGLHQRVIAGIHRIPGDGTRCTSRIHVQDLARLVLASALRSARADTFVVGDLAPAPQLETVRWVCDTYGLPMPPCVPLESVHESLRGDRRVDGARALSTFGVTLEFPTYRDGMARVPPPSGERA
jgi:nucleoside-diphosphate-sugar epimerase